MNQIINDLWRLPRELVSDGFDKALFDLAKILPLKISQYPTGSCCWTWVIPEKWSCHDAYLETLAGKKVFDYKQSPFYCMPYSLPFEGVVKREELFKHLHTNPRFPDAIPYAPKFYERDWGLCCSQKQKDALSEKEYRVVIKTEFSSGKLKVGEMVIPGKSKESFMLCAHLCHGYTVNDGLSGVAVGAEVMQRLVQKKGLYYTYRFLVVPETIGSISWLAHNEKLIPKIKAGLFLEMLGTDTAHSLQLSYQADTLVDNCFSDVLKNKDPLSWIGKFGEVICNDERQFNSPGARIPMLSLSRVHAKDSGKWPYPQYHTNFDTPEIISEKRLNQSAQLVMDMLEVFENNYYVINLYKGEIFCSRFGLHRDFFKEPEANRRIFRMMHAIDGTKTVYEIARESLVSFQDCWEFISKLKGYDLVAFSRQPVKQRKR